MVVKAFFEIRKMEAAKGSVMNNLRALSDDPFCPEAVRESAGRFLLQITPEHVLPGNIDLLDEVERLKAALFPDC